MGTNGMTTLATLVGFHAVRGARYVGGGGTLAVLLIAGLVFAGLVVWAIQSSGRRAV